jgi:hypothetical protein
VYCHGFRDKTLRVRKTPFPFVYYGRFGCPIRPDRVVRWGEGEVRSLTLALSGDRLAERAGHVGSYMGRPGLGWGWGWRLQLGLGAPFRCSTIGNPMPTATGTGSSASVGPAGAALS